MIDYSICLVDKQRGAITDITCFESLDFDYIDSFKEIRINVDRQKHFSGKSHKKRFSIKTVRDFFKTLLILFLVTVAIIVPRFLFLEHHLKTLNNLGQMTNLWADYYLNLLGVNSLMADIILVDDTGTVGGMSPTNFLQKLSADLHSVSEHILEMKKSSLGQGKKVLNQYLELKTCDMLRLVAYDRENFPGGFEGSTFENCDKAIGGITSEDMENFIRKYPQVIDSFLSEFKRADTPDKRRELLTRRIFASLLAYSQYNLFGVADAIYYTILVPSFSKFSADSELMVGYASTTQTISWLIWGPVIGVFALLAPFQFRRIIHTIYGPLNLIPISVLGGINYFSMIVRTKKSLFSIF